MLKLAGVTVTALAAVAIVAIGPMAKRQKPAFIDAPLTRRVDYTINSVETANGGGRRTAPQVNVLGMLKLALRASGEVDGRADKNTRK